MSILASDIGRLSAGLEIRSHWLSFVSLWRIEMRRFHPAGIRFAVLFAAAFVHSPVLADPCGLSPPVYFGISVPLARGGEPRVFAGDDHA